MRLLADSEGQLNATLCENSRGPLHPILGIYEAEYYDLVTTSFGSFVTGRNHPRQASKHQAQHHLSGQVQKVRPGFPSAAALASLARSHPERRLKWMTTGGEEFMVWRTISAQKRVMRWRNRKSHPSGYVYCGKFVAISVCRGPVTHRCPVMLRHKPRVVKKQLARGDQPNDRPKIP